MRYDAHGARAYVAFEVTRWSDLTEEEFPNLRPLKAPRLVLEKHAQHIS